MFKNCSLYTLLTVTDQKPQKSVKSSINHTNIDIQATSLWLIVPFMIFAVFYPSPLTAVQTAVFMVALCNRADHYIFAL